LLVSTEQADELSVIQTSRQKAKEHRE